MSIVWYLVSSPGVFSMTISRLWC